MPESAPPDRAAPGTDAARVGGTVDEPLDRGPDALVVVDLQVVFADPASGWATPGFADVVPVVRSLVEAFDAAGAPVAFTRFLAPERPAGAWVEYYERWPFALRPAGDALWDLVDGTGRRPEHPVVDATTFGKWGEGLASATAGASSLVLAGVSTDCCVLSTALGAADAGVAVRVAADACAGVSVADHERALAAMALYDPLVRVVDAASVLADLRPRLHQAPAMTADEVLVDLDVLVAPGDEDVLAGAVRASVASVVRTAALGRARWGEAIGGEDLLHQWDVERAGAPLGGRRVRRLTMSVRAVGVTDSLEEIVWAAIDAVCPTAREERWLLDAGRTPVPAVPDRWPWSSATRAVGGDGG